MKINNKWRVKMILIKLGMDLMDKQLLKDHNLDNSSIKDCKILELQSVDVEFVECDEDYRQNKPCC